MLTLRTIWIPLCLSGALFAQEPKRITDFGGSPGKASGGAAFVDFSKDLELVSVSVVLGKLDQWKDGRRKRIKDSEAHIGKHGGVSRMSGTQFYRVQSKTTLQVDAELAGTELGKKKLTLAFDVQLARLPDGTERRQILGSTRETLDVGVDALFVLQKNRKKRRYEILHVIKRPEDQRAEAFRKDVEDITAINRRIVALRAALQEADRLRKKDRDVAIGTLDKALDDKVALAEPANDQLASRHIDPWSRRLQDLRKELAPPPKRD